MVSEGTDYRTRRRPWVLLILSNCQRNWRERGRRCRCALDDGEMSCVNAGVLVGPARRHRRLRRHRHRLAGQCRERYVHVRVIARLYIVARAHTHTHTHVNRVPTADFIVTEDWWLARPTAAWDDWGLVFILFTLTLRWEELPSFSVPISSFQSPLEPVLFCDGTSRYGVPENLTIG